MFRVHIFKEFFCTPNSCVSDVNECSDSTHDCSEFAVCADIDGSYECSCNFGYTGNGTVCTSKIFVVYTYICCFFFKSMQP